MKKTSEIFSVLKETHWMGLEEIIEELTQNLLII